MNHQTMKILTVLFYLAFLAPWKLKKEKEGKKKSINKICRTRFVKVKSRERINEWKDRIWVCLGSKLK